MRNLLDPDAALERVLTSAARRPLEHVSLHEAAGLILGADVLADCDYPPFDRVMMDGFAVRCADAGRTVRIVGEITPGRGWSQPLAAGEALAVMTGAALPPGAEAVVPIELVSVGEGSVTLPPMIRPGDHIAPRGGERRAGEIVLPAGSTLTPLAVGALAQAGVSTPQVFAAPRVAVISTGDELADVSASVPGPLHIRDSNTPLLRAMLSAANFLPVRMERVTDSPEAILTALRRCEDCDAVVTTGGVSAGTHDYVPDAAASDGWTTIFHKVSQRPGKPFLFACKGLRLWFGLPGNPLAVHLCTHRYVIPALRLMAGLPPLAPRAYGRLEARVGGDAQRTAFVLMCADRSRGGWALSPLPCRNSADLFGVATANALVRVPPGGHLAQGDEVLFEWLPGAEPAISQANEDQPHA